MEIGQYPLIPKEAFLYFPEDKDILQFRQNDHNKPYRYIFEGGVTYSSYEKQKIGQLQSYIRKENKASHIALMPEHTLLRFLQATKYDVEDCLEALIKYKIWWDSISPLILRPEIEQLLKKGLLYMVGRDFKYRPIIVVDVEKIKQADLNEKTFESLMGYFFQYIVENCMVEGQVQTWVTIVDLAKMGLFSLGGTVMDTIKFLSNHFRCRLHHNYLVNCPGSMTFLFGMIKGALSEDQIAKITLCEDSGLPNEAFREIKQDQIERKYGGYKKNLIQFWPISNQHFLPAKELKHRFISLEKYGKLRESRQLGMKKKSRILLDEYDQMIKQKEEEEARNFKMKESQEVKKWTASLKQPPWEDPPKIKGIPSPFSMMSIFNMKKAHK